MAVNGKPVIDGTNTTRATVAQSIPRRPRPCRGVVRRAASPRPSTAPPQLVCLRGLLHIRISCCAVFDTRPGPTVHPGEPQGKGPLEGLHRPNVSFPRGIQACASLSMHRPESQGLVCASVYILLLILFIPFPFSDTVGNLPQSRKTLEGLQGVASLHHEVRRYAPIGYTLLQCNLVVRIPFLVAVAVDGDHTGIPGRRL